MRVTFYQIKDEFALLTKEYGELYERLYDAETALAEERERLNWALRNGYSPIIYDGIALEPQLEGCRAAIDEARKEKK